MKVMNLLEFHIDHSSAMRLHLWRAYFQMFADHPWFGVGLFQGDKLLPEYYQRLGIVEPFTSHAHNVPLQWLAGAGVFALLVYLYVAFYFLRLSWRLRSLSVWGLSLFCAQLYWHIGSLTEANFFDGEVNHFIVFTWALVLYLSRQPHLKVNNG
jgi:O-antigen ligase